MLDIQSPDDMLSHPELFWTEWTYVCLLCRTFHSRTLSWMLPGLLSVSKLKYHLFLWIVWWKSNAFKILFSNWANHVGNRTIFQMMATRRRLWFIMGGVFGLHKTITVACVPNKTTTSVLVLSVLKWLRNCVHFGEVCTVDTRRHQLVSSLKPWSLFCLIYHLLHGEFCCCCCR